MDIIIRDGIWAFLTILGEQRVYSAANKVDVLITPIGLLIVSLMMYVLPFTANQIAAYIRSVRCYIAIPALLTHIDCSWYGSVLSLTASS